MPFLDDFANAVQTYPVDSVVVSILPPAYVSGGTPGGTVNINEIWRFRVRIRNNGHLVMNNVNFLIQGQNGASVGITAAAAAAAAANNAINFFPNLTVNGHGGQQDTVDLFFQAPNAQRPAGTLLVKADIQGWNANLLDILNNHSDASNEATEGRFEPVVQG